MRLQIKKWNITVVPSGSRSSSVVLNPKNEYKILIVLSALVAAGIWWLHLLSPGLEGGMDSYNHYLIARYSWQHPDLFLHYWGKPIYNLLSSPFAQLGIKGAVAFNIICLLSSAWLSWLLAKRLNLKQAWVAFVLCLFSPIFLANTISSLTEPLSAVLVIWTVYLLSSEKWLAGASLAGFLPYARSEGFVVLAVVGFFLLIVKRRYVALAFLLVGTLVFNFLGWAIEGDPFWAITSNPYIQFERSGNDVCGSGSFFTYVLQGHYTFGLLCGILMAISTALLLRDIWFKRLNGVKKPLFFLVLGTFALYFLVHSAIWSMGMMGSCGYIRVMVVIAPLGAVLAAHAFGFILDKIKPVYGLILSGILAGNALYAPVKYYAYQYPMQISQEQVEFTRLNHWIQDQDLNDRRWVYMYPYLSILAEIDPWDHQRHAELWMTSLPYLDKGDIVIWDSHFGANEGGIPLDHLLDHPEYRLLHQIHPENPFRTLNNYDFSIYVFEKLTESES